MKASGIKEKMEEKAIYGRPTARPRLEQGPPVSADNRFELEEQVRTMCYRPIFPLAGSWVGSIAFVN
jgi:hypothetical protein